MKIYTGVGSRETPQNIVDDIQGFARRLGQLGYLLRSGAAAGADMAFEQGCDSVGGAKQIWLPWSGFNGHASGYTPKLVHYTAAAKVHPAWSKLSSGVKSLHARNIGQVGGYDTKTLSEFVLCWTADGCEEESERTKETGGTATAVVYARRMGVPVFNLGRPSSRDAFVRHMKGERVAPVPDWELFS